MIVRLLAPDGTPVQIETHGPGDHLTRQIMGGLWYERDLLDAIRERDRVGAYVDVGAHIGQHSLWFGLACPATRVVAIEPWPASAAVLRRNLAQLRCPVDVIEASAGNGETVRLTEPPAGNIAVHSIPDPAGARSVRLDDIDAGPVAVIKIDVDGAEARVLAGAEETIRRDRPLLAVEALPGAEQVALSRWADLHDYRIGGCYCISPTFLLEPA